MARALSNKKPVIQTFEGYGVIWGKGKDKNFWVYKTQKECATITGQPVIKVKMTYEIIKEEE